VPFVYGLPTLAANKKVDEGRIALGRCTLMEALSPEWYCKACGNEWGVYRVQS
jgi:hypothetical protein